MPIARTKCSLKLQKVAWKIWLTPKHPASYQVQTSKCIWLCFSALTLWLLFISKPNLPQCGTHIPHFLNIVCCMLKLKWWHCSDVFWCMTFIHQITSYQCGQWNCGDIESSSSDPCLLFHAFLLMHLGYINNLFICNKKQTSPHYSLIETSASFVVDSRDVLLCGDKWEVMRSFVPLI